MLNRESDEYELAIVGNGPIGLFAAIEIAQKYPDIKLCVIGPAERYKSATLAAGAMCAVYGEVEKNTFRCETSNLIFEKSREANKLWEEFFDRNKGTKTAQSTIVYLKQGASNLEKENFFAALNVASVHNVAEELSYHENRFLFEEFGKKNERVFRIKNEYGMDPDAIFRALEELAKTNKISFYDSFCKSIVKRKENWHLTLSNADFLSSKKIVLCAGAMTTSILGIPEPTIPIISGVGSAIRTDAPTRVNKFGSVIRTVNRGGANCGIHVVPHPKSTYVGAGNYISLNASNEHRLETIRYLISCLEDDLMTQKEVYQLKGSPIIGERARSIDGLPNFGYYANDKSIFVASGFNRVGLTLAPALAHLILPWFEGKPLPKSLNKWRPDRVLQSYGKEIETVQDFKNSRIANAFEHKLITSDLQRADLEKVLEEFAVKSLAFLRDFFSCPKDFNFQPDLIAPLIEAVKEKNKSPVLLATRRVIPK